MDGGDRTVMVSNISPQLLESHLRELFECCGTIVSMHLDSSAGCCKITYQDPGHARAAVFLSSTPLGDRPIVVTLCTFVSPLPYDKNPMMPMGMQSSREIEDKRLQEIQRTIYVGNVNTTLTDEAIREFFASNFGEVLYTKFGGDADGTRPTRFTFIEFATVQSAKKALDSSGIVFGGYPLKIRNANNSILKASTAQQPPKKDLSSIMSKVLAATSKIGSKVLENETPRERERDRDRDRDRARDRNRDDRRRDRGRDRFTYRNDKEDSARCFNCNERGHFSRECTKPRERQPSTNRRKTNNAPSREGMFFNGYKWEPIENKVKYTGGISNTGV